MTKSWKDKALEATGGNKTQFGAILECAFDPDHSRPMSFPRFTGKAIVTSDGFVQCSFYDRNGTFRQSAFIGSLRDLHSNAVRLAEFLEFSEDDRDALFKALRAWVDTDYSGRVTALFGRVGA